MRKQSKTTLLSLTILGVLLGISALSLGSSSFYIELGADIGVVGNLVQVNFKDSEGQSLKQTLVPEGTIIKVEEDVPGYQYTAKDDAGETINERAIFSDFIVPEKVSQIDLVEFAPIPETGFVTFSDYVQQGSVDHLSVNLTTGSSADLNASVFLPDSRERMGLNEKYVLLDVADNFSLNKPLSFITGSSYSTDGNQRNLNSGAPTTAHAATHITEANRLITIVLKSDLVIGNGGSLGVEAITSRRSAGLSGDVITGSYTELDLNGHTITLQSGANFYQHGRVIDSSINRSGKIVVENGAHMVGGLVVEDFNGGNVTVGSYLANSAPFFLFSMPNLEATLEVKYGGKFGGDTSLFAQGDYGKTEVPLIGPDSSYMVQIQDSSSKVVRYVKGSHTVDSSFGANVANYWKPYIVDYREEFVLIGPGDSSNQSFNLNAMVLPIDMSAEMMGMNVVVTAEVSFMEMDFPVAPWMHFYLQNGASLNFGNTFGFLPGSSLDVDSSSKLIFSKRSATAQILPHLAGSSTAILPQEMSFTGEAILRAYDNFPLPAYYSTSYYPYFSASFNSWDSLVKPAFFNLEGSFALDSNMTSSDVFGIGGETHLGPEARTFLATQTQSTFLTTPVGVMRRGAVTLDDLVSWVIPDWFFPDIFHGGGPMPQIGANVLYSAAPLACDGYVVRDLASLKDNVSSPYNPSEKWIYDPVDSLIKKYAGDNLLNVCFYKFDDSYDSNFGNTWLTSPNGTWVEGNRLNDGSYGEVELPNFQASLEEGVGRKVIPFVSYGGGYFAKFGGSYVQMLNMITSNFSRLLTRTRTESQTGKYQAFQGWKPDGESTYTSWAYQISTNVENGYQTIDSLTTLGTLSSMPTRQANGRIYGNLAIIRSKVMNGNSADSDNPTTFASASNHNQSSLLSNLGQGVTAPPTSAEESSWSGASTTNSEWEYSGITSIDSKSRSRTNTQTISVFGKSQSLGYGYFYFDTGRALWRLVWCDSVH